MVYYEYEVNKEYITLKYCENKNKPSLKCNGSCQLMKRLNAGFKQEVPDKKLELLGELQLFNELPDTNIFLISSGNLNFNLPSQDTIASFTPPVFHPPSMLV